MSIKYKIHPAIGIARLGNSPDEFYLSPESPGALPIKCDDRGNPITDGSGNLIRDKKFKDSEGRVKRQAARFRIFVYDDENPLGRPIKVGDTIQGVVGKGKLVDIHWTVYPANKKSAWYEFKQLEGEHGYAPDHPLRNADVTGDDRANLIIDPGPQTVRALNSPRKASFAKGENPFKTQIFPPPLQPNSIDTLGELMTNDHLECVVLGGYGNSGSFKTGFSHPQITSYANNDGWFDDTADGPVTAILEYFDEVDKENRFVQVHDSAWLIIGYPGYAPQIQDLISMDELIYDLSVREFAYNTYLYGTGNFNSPQEIDISDPDELSLWRDTVKYFNPDYVPYFWRDIFSILVRPFQMHWVTDFLQISNDAHQMGARGDFDLRYISVSPKWLKPEEVLASKELLDNLERQRTLKARIQNGDAIIEASYEIKDVPHLKELLEAQSNGKAIILEVLYDQYGYLRSLIYDALRQKGEENKYLNDTADPRTFIFNKPLMPLMAGDNPISNDIPSKFLRLTDTQLFLIRQWKDGKFINEKTEGIQPDGMEPEPPENNGTIIDHGVMSNVLGGAFCPGGEVGWIMRNPAIYKSPYRININPKYIPTAGSGRGSGIAEFLPPPLDQADDFMTGIQPGDLTKHMALPWQADYNECYTFPIDVTYEEWSVIYDSADDIGVQKSKNADTLWWPSHRPIQVYTAEGKQVDWAYGIPGTNAGDFKMVTEWKKLGFVLNIGSDDLFNANFIEVERNEPRSE